MLDKLQEQFLKREKNSIREKAWTKFQALGFPHAKSESFRYLSLKKLDGNFFKEQKSEIDFSSWIRPGFEDSCLIFIDGHFSKTHSRLKNLADLVLLPFLDSFASYGIFVENHLNKFFKNETDPFSFLNLALHQEGIFFYLPSKASKMKIQILCVNTKEDFSMPKIQGIFGENTQVDLIHTSIGSSNGFTHTDFDFVLEKNADVRSCSYIHESKEERYFSSFRANLKENSKLHAYFAPSHMPMFRQQCHISLVGTQAEAILSGLNSCTKTDEVHWHTCMEHVAENCQSSQQFRGVLADESRSSFEGKIYVHPQAQKTDSYQSNRNLILDDTAKAFAKPNLEIYADDVKASHGATISQVSEEQLFYLKSRGLSKSSAKKLLVKGFYRELLEKCPIQSIISLIERGVQ